MPSPNIPTNADELGGVKWVEISIPLTALTILIVGFRVWWRMRLVGKLGNADIAIIGATVMLIAQQIIGCVGILKYGFGHHGAYLGIEKIQKSLMYFYIYQIPYKILVSLTKISFLFLYIDIFTFPRFKQVCWAINISVIAAMFAFTLTTIVQCTPIPFNWNKSIKGGFCINAPTFWYAHAGWNTAFDIIILVLPIPVIKSLHMARNQKAALMGVFALGAFVCITSIMRMVTLDIAAKATLADLTYATGSAFIWTQVESSAGIICACLPTLKTLVTKILPSVFGSGQASSNAYNLDDVNKLGTGQGWKKNSIYHSKARQDFDGGSSQERIIGIKKTVDVTVDRPDNINRSEDTYQNIFPGPKPN